MKEKINHLFNTPLKKTASIFACATLVLSLGAVSAFATGIVLNPSAGSLVRSDNGNVNYSTDGGVTWNQGKMPLPPRLKTA